MKHSFVTFQILRARQVCSDIKFQSSAKQALNRLFRMTIKPCMNIFVLPGSSKCIFPRDSSGLDDFPISLDLSYASFHVSLAKRRVYILVRVLYKYLFDFQVDYCAAAVQQLRHLSPGISDSFGALLEKQDTADLRAVNELASA